jgi:hypothetical protein
MKKGQAAMEFLMTYGWAILVVLAAIGALAYFGVLSPDRFLPDKCTISGGYSCGEYKVNSSGVYLKIINNQGVDVTSTTVTFNSTSPAGCNGVNTTGVTVNGESVTGTNLMPFACTLTTGGKIKGTITIDSIKNQETVSHRTTGSIQAKIE